MSFFKKLINFSARMNTIKILRQHKSILATLFLAVLVSMSVSSVGQQNVFAAGTLPCDIYASAGTPCVAAHSTTRALFGTYSGNLYQVKRASDSATTNIGTLAAGGYANAAAQDTFCSGTSCTITIIYDQTSRHNDLTISPAGGAGGADVGAVANALSAVAGGNKVYGVYVAPGTGYRDLAATGTAVNGQPEGMYMVTSGTHVNGGCCFDYGNTEQPLANDTGNGHMDAVYFGLRCEHAPCSGSGPWIAADLENGLFQGNGSNTGDATVNYDLVTAMLKNNGQNTFALKTGNAQSGGLTTQYNGTLPNGSYTGYNPMHQEGGIVLGVGGDNSNASDGSFFEGVMTSGYPTDAAENSVQANIVSVSYGVPTYASVVPTSEITAQSWKYTTTTPASGWQNTGFNDTAWSTGNGGFGTAGTPGAIIGTTWNTADIWLRRTFNPGSLTASQISNLVFRLHHDEGAELYINGVLAATVTGYATAYDYIPMTTAGQNAVVINGNNVLAVHCHQTTGGQYIDAGIFMQVLPGGGSTPTFQPPTKTPVGVTSTPVGGPPSNGQILDWPFDAGSGTTVADYSGQNNTGTLVNGPTWTTVGKSGDALIFNGTNNYVDANKNVATTSGDFSVSAWVKLNSLTGWQTFVSQDGTNISGFYLQYGAALGNKFGMAMLGSDATTATPFRAVSTSSPTTGTWYHLVGVHSGSNVLLYVNGVLQRTMGVTGSWNAAGHTVVGRALWAGGQTDWSNGTIDQVRIYNRALSASEVSTIYNSGT